MTAQVDDALWDEFHTLVNMTSRELQDWLATDDAKEESEPAVGPVGTPTGRAVLAVLGKGHESGQEVNGEVLPFDDRVELAAALREASA